MDSIQIQCPDCQQRFDVGSNFMGKMAECGSCDARFRITAEHIYQENTKIYPGEKQKIGHRNFRATTTMPDQPVAFQTVNYNANVQVEHMLPMRPKHKMAVGLAFVILIIFALIFTAGNSAISDITTTNRYLLAIIISVIALALLLYSARRRILTMMTGLVLIAVLCSAPFFFKYEEPPSSQQNAIVENEFEDIEAAFQASALNKEDLGYDKVREAIDEAKGEESSVIAYALYGYLDSHQDVLTRYLYESYGEKDYPSFFKERAIGEESITLVVIKQVNIDSLSVAANIAMPFGSVEKVHRDLRVIEVRVDQDKIQGDPESHYMSENSPYFFEANYRELSHIDRERRVNALTRITKATSHKQRIDFVRKLVSMLDENHSNKDIGLIIEALNHWSFPEDNIQKGVLQAIEKLHDSAGNIELGTMAYLIEQAVPGREPIISKIWAANPVQWQAAIVATGNLGKNAVLLQFPELNAAQMNSAASILRELGSTEDLSLIEACLDSGDENSRLAMKATIDEIKSRQ